MNQDEGSWTDISVVSLVHPSLLTSQQTETVNGELTPFSSTLHPDTFSNFTPTSIISPPTSIFNTPTSTAITGDGLTILRCGKNNEIESKNLRISSSNSKDNSQQIPVHSLTSSNPTPQPVLIHSKSIQTSHPALKRSAPSPILTLIRPNSTSTQTWVNSDPTMRPTTIKSNPKLLTLSCFSKPSSANQTNPSFNIIQTQPNLPFGSNVQSHNCRLVKVVQKSHSTTASNVQSPNCTRIDYVLSPPVVTVERLKETDDTWNTSTEINEVDEQNTFDQSEFQEVSSSLIPVVGTPESEVELDETVSNYKIKLLKDANDNRPRGGGKLLGTEGGKLLRSEGGKLDELGELDGGGEKMMVYEDITSLCLPDVQSSSPDPSDPCSSTSYTVQGKEDVPKRFCLVCGDTASGFHYGVSSCEACKAFFKRTIQGNIDYSCPASGDCEINKRRRKACQACRYQKCIRKGMLKEGVRLDRVRGGRQKYRRLTEGTVYGEINSTRRVSLEDNYMLECLTISEPDPISILDCEPCTKLGELRTAAVLADVYDRELVLTIGWAKQVPGFSELSLNDQMKMLQCSWTEVLTLTLVYRSLPKQGLLNFATDFSLTKAEAEQVGLLQFFQKCMLIIEKMASLTLYREEYLILKSLVLVNSDCSIEMKDRVEGIKESVISSLQDCSSVLRCVDPSLAVNQLLLLLPSLREADNLLRIFWLKIRKEGRVQMNRLLVEMLES